MIPIFKPYMPENIIPEIDKILYSSKLSYGEIGKEFEKKLAVYIDNEKVLTISSYNQALLILLSTLGLKAGDEIITSPVSCLASNQPFVVKGLKVVWADIDPKRGTLNVDDVRSKITSSTKAIFHNHYCGYLGNINEINASQYIYFMVYTTVLSHQAGVSKQKYKIRLPHIYTNKMVHNISIYLYLHFGY